MKINIIIITFAITLMQLTQVYAEDHLFINTFPLRASVFIGNKDSGVQTPCILKEEQLKNTIVTIKKDGYRDYHVTESDKNSGEVEITLIPVDFDLYFPGKNTYLIGDTQLKGPVYVTDLKPGDYEISLLNNRIAFNKRNNFTIAEASLGTALALSLAGMVTSIVLSEYFASQAYGADKDSEEYIFYKKSTEGMDNVKYAAIGITSTVTVALSSVVIADLVTRYSKSNKKGMRVINKSPTDQDATLYETAVQFLASGEIERSTQLLKSILALYPESDLVPLIHYQLGQNYFIANKMSEARKYWETFIGDYPTSKYYDYVIKNLSDIYYVEKDYDAARNILDRAIFTNNILNKESIESQKAKLDYERFNTQKSDAIFETAVKEYQDLIKTYNNSERIDSYYLMLVKLYKSKGMTDKIGELKKEVTDNLNMQQGIKNLILSNM